MEKKVLTKKFFLNKIKRIFKFLNWINFKQIKKKEFGEKNKFFQKHKKRREFVLKKREENFVKIKSKIISKIKRKINNYKNLLKKTNLSHRLQLH